MVYIVIILIFIIGFFLGFGVAWFSKKYSTNSAKEIANELLTINENKVTEERDRFFERVRDSFSTLSMEALKSSTDQFFKMAKDKMDSERELSSKELESKKNLIDQQLHRMNGELEKVTQTINTFEKDREQKFGAIEKYLIETNKNTSELTRSTSSLREALASSKQRGQWGERMAEDVLNLAGFIEGVNYFKQKTLTSTGEKPDFTFILPQKKILNMDVKFPFDNYLKSIETDSDNDREKYVKMFLKDVKSRIAEVSSKAYINPEENTVDYVLLFIPNEQIYSYIHEQDSILLEEGLKKKVIVCSPITLFAVLAVIRAAMDNFVMEQTSHRVLELMGQFKDQWGKFIEALENLGKHIRAVQNDYNTIVTTRKNQLEKPLTRIDMLRIENTGETIDNPPAE